MLKCKRCGSETFKALIEMIISDITSAEDDILANRTIEQERVIRLECAECGYLIRGQDEG